MINIDENKKTISMQILLSTKKHFKKIQKQIKLIQNRINEIKKNDINADTTAYEECLELQKGHKRAYKRCIKQHIKNIQTIEKVLKHRKTIELKMKSTPKEEQDEFILELLKMSDEKLEGFYKFMTENVYIL